MLHCRTLTKLLLLCSEIAKDLKCNLCAYDYTGYGQSKGRASIPDTIADINAVFQWLLRRGIQKQDIILYGQSLGSGPTLDLAARERGIAGVVLHAAFASGVPQASLGRTVLPALAFSCLPLQAPNSAQGFSAVMLCQGLYIYGPADFISGSSCHTSQPSTSIMGVCHGTGCLC